MSATYHRGKHRDVDAGQGTLLPGKFLLVAYLMENSIKVQEQSEIGRGQLSTRLFPKPGIFTRVRSIETCSVATVARHVISHAYYLFAYLLTAVRIASSHSYVIPSQECVFARVHAFGSALTYYLVFTWWVFCAILCPRGMYVCA